MLILSVNVGRPRAMEWHGRTIVTSIFKQPVAGPVQVAEVNLVGDEQADLRVHGGPDKAVYAYDVDHYTTWRSLLPDWTDWSPGLFGENLTTGGLLESEVRIGDVFGIGTARLRAVQTRQSCYKLNVRFNNASIVSQFARLGRSGIYFRVVEPGTVQAGDSLELLERAPAPITIQNVAQLLLSRSHEAARLAEVLALPHLPESLKQYLAHR